MIIDPDSFDEWQAHPITELLYRLCDAEIKNAQERWMAASLEGGRCDPLVLKEITARIATLREIKALTAMDFEERLSWATRQELNH
jgi:hypothetical protein